MKKTKRILILIFILALVMCLLLGLTAYLYTYIISDYTYDFGFEFHIYPEEYEEEYSAHTETIALDRNTDYQIRIDAACETGTMELIIYSVSEGEKHYTVDRNTPHNEVIQIPKNTADELTITVRYNADTKGTLLGEVLVHKHYFLI